MKYRVPKAPNMPLLTFGIPTDDFVVVVTLCSIMVVVLKNAGVQSFMFSIALPIGAGFGLAYFFKKINEVRPVGYLRHIIHKYGIWNDKMRGNHLIAPGKRRYSP